MKTKLPVKGNESDADHNFFTPTDNLEENPKASSSSESEEEEDSNSTQPEDKNNTLPQEEAVQSDNDYEEETQKPKHSATLTEDKKTTLLQHEAVESDSDNEEDDDIEGEPQEPKHSATPTEDKKAEDECVKNRYHRVFSQDDEVSLLQGVHAYLAQNGKDPYGDIVNFHEFIKKENHSYVSTKVLKDVSSKQLKEKIRRLNRKYRNVVKKCEENPAMTLNTHDLKLFDLSKKIWGSENANVNEKGEDERVGRAGCSEDDGNIGKKRKKLVNSQGEESHNFWAKFPFCVDWLMNIDGFSASTKRLYVQKLELIGMEKLKEYEAKLKKIKLVELELCIHKRGLTNGILRLLCDASNPYH